MSEALRQLPLWADLVVAVLLVAGAFFTLIGALGLAKLSTIERRLHGPTKASTLGVGGVLLASIVHFAVRDGGLYGHELLITLFVFITAPISAHLVVKSALHLSGRDAATADRPPSPPDRAT